MINKRNPSSSRQRTWLHNPRASVLSKSRCSCKKIHVSFADLCACKLLTEQSGKALRKDKRLGYNIEVLDSLSRDTATKQMHIDPIFCIA